MTTTPLPPFYKLVDDHGDEVAAYVRRLTGDEWEDAMQETLLRALRSYPRLRHADHLRAWLYRVATTTIYDLGSARRKETPVESVPEQVADPDFVDHAFEELTERLTPSARAALTLRFVDDLTYEDIAARLECSPAAARQRVSTAVRRLREVL